jgi:hypothetical protein
MNYFYNVIADITHMRHKHNSKKSQKGGFLPALMKALPMFSKQSKNASNMSNLVIDSDPLMHIGKDADKIQKAAAEQAVAVESDKVRELARKQEEMLEKDEELKRTIKEQAEAANEIERKMVELKSKERILERVENLDPKYVGNGPNNIQEFKIYAMISSIITICIAIVTILSYVISIGVTVLSFANIIILVVVALFHLIYNDNDTIYKDTLKYRLLRYTDIMFNPNMPEPYFNIYFINFCLILIFILFGLLFLIFVFSFIIILVFMFIPLLNRNFKMDSMNKDEYSKYTFSGVFIGLIFASIVYSFYRIYFMNVLYPEISNVRTAIQKIDVLIKEELLKSANTFNLNLFKILRNKGVGNTNGEYQEFNKYIMTDVNSKRYAAAKQKLILITLYSHLYDNIPHTNQKALELINYYFFKDPNTLDNTLNIRTADEMTDLTFISLMVQNKGVTPIVKIYEDPKFQQLYKSTDQGVKTMMEEVDMFINSINQKILKFPDFKNVTDLFAIYMTISFVICIFCVIIYNFIIKTNTQLYEKSILNLANGFNNLIIASVPMLGDVVARSTDPAAYSKCKSITDKAQRRNCVSSILK